MQEDLSSAIIASMSDGLLVINSRGVLTRINPSALEKLGLTSEAEGSNYSLIFMNDPENDAFNDILFDGLQRGESRNYGEVVFCRSDGRRIDLAVTTSFLRTSDPDNRSIVVVFKDITELKELDRARKRVLSHLSHELKTPVSILLASIKPLATPDNQRTIKRIQRNLDRLVSLQVEVEDIVRGTPHRSHTTLAPWVEQALDLVEMVAEESPEQKAALALIRNKIECDFAFEPSRLGPVSLAETIHKVLQELPEAARARRVSIETRLDTDATPFFDPKTLAKIVEGLVRNAIEHTPDGGSITIGLASLDSMTSLRVVDTGVGITETSLRQIFGGFYHAIDTNFYSTGLPYRFGSGGKGLDLLRARIYTEMFGCRIDCQSTRCRHIPDEKDICPGDISRCPHVSNASECAEAGGSTFQLSFPLPPPQP